jgi:hypothetical protein
MYFEGIALIKKVSDFTDEQGRPRIQDAESETGREDNDRVDF